MKALAGLLILLSFIAPVAAMDYKVLRQNSKLSRKLNSLEYKLERLEAHLDSKRYRKRAKKLLRSQRILAKRFAKINGYKLSLSKNDLETNNQILSDAINAIVEEAGTGIHGYITLIEGNCMPGPGLPHSSCQMNLVERELIIMPATEISDDYVYYDFDEQPIATTNSNKNGYYALALKPGTYSVFVEDEGRYYCNYYTGDGYACLIEIEEGQNLAHDVDIDHAFW